MKKSQNPPKKQKLFKEEKPKKSNIPEIKPPVTKGMPLFDIIFKGHYGTHLVLLNMIFSIGPTAEASKSERTCQAYW